MSTVSQRISLIYGRLGRSVYRTPHFYLCMPLLLFTFSLHPFFSALYHLNNEKRTLGAADLFSPVDSSVNNDRDKIGASFPDGGYFADRTFLTGNIRIVLVKVHNGSIFDRNTMRYYGQLRTTLDSLKITVNGQNISYSTLCSTVTAVGHCRPDPLLLFDQFDSGRMPAYPYANLSIGPLSRLVNLGPLLGDVGISPDLSIQKASLARMIFDFPPMSNYTHIELLEKVWMSVLDSPGVPSGIETYFWSPTQYECDMKTIGKRTSRLIPVLVVCLSLFSILSSKDRSGDIVAAKPLLALAGVISSGLGVITSIGLLHVFHFQLIQIAMLTPFLVLSIGIDDMFITISVWRTAKREHPKATVEELVGITYEECSVSILLTTIGNVFVYGTGALSSFPAIRLFCIYCCFSLFIVYIFQISFFGALLALDADREMERKHPITLKTIKAWFLISIILGPSASVTPSLSSISSRSALSSRPYHFIPTSSPLTLSLSALSYLIYISLSAYVLCFHIKTGLEVSSLLPSDTKTYKYLKIYEEHFHHYNTPMELMLNKGIDYSDRAERNRVLAAIASLEMTPFTMRAQWWLSDLRDFMENDMQMALPDKEVDLVFMIKNVFLQHPMYRNYAKDIIFDGDEINRTRLFLPLRNVNVNTRLEAYNFLQSRMRLISSTYSLNLTSFDVSFSLAEQTDRIPPLVIENLVTAGLMTILSVLILVPSLLNCILMTWAVLSINAGVFAVLVMTGSRLDVVSAITSLLSVGYSVDFSSHLLAHYHTFRRQKADPLVSTLSVVSMPILHSSLSTILGVLCVSPVPGYVSHSFIHTVIAVCVVGAYHSLILLPGILRIVE